MNNVPRTILLAALACCVCLTGTAHAQAARRTRLDPTYEQRSFKGSGDAQLSYGWLVPLNKKEGEKYPLVICLHGSGGGTGASAVLAGHGMREKHPAFVMVPAAEQPFTWAVTDVFKRKSGPAAGPEKLPVLLDAIRAALKAEAIDPARVYITGQSMGGVGTWGAIARQPDLFAAAVPVCGAWNVGDVPKMTSVPIWAFHGGNDNTVPVQFSRDLTAAVTAAGGVVKYTEYPGVGHDSWTKAYAGDEMWQWLFAQRKTAKAK